MAFGVYTFSPRYLFLLENRRGGEGGERRGEEGCLKHLFKKGGRGGRRKPGNRSNREGEEGLYWNIDGK